MRCIPSVRVLVLLVLGLHQECVATSTWYIVQPGWPAHVAIYERYGTQDQDSPVCSGTLVKLDLILSSDPRSFITNFISIYVSFRQGISQAAHCLYDERTGRVKNVSEFWVSAGKPPRHRVSPIKRIDVPEGYSGSSGYYSNDIALVRLSKSYDQTRVTGPIDPNCNIVIQSDEHGMLGELYGSASDKTGKPLVASDYITHGNCSTTISTQFGGTLPDDKFCIDSTIDVNRHSEDSGSGLYDSWKLDGCLGGILSITPNATTGDYVTHAIFTSVSYHLNWIRAFISEARNHTAAQLGCILPAQPANGSFQLRSCSRKCSDGLVPEGSVLYFQCNKGYTLQGKNTQICTNNGWSQSPRCECGFFSYIGHPGWGAYVRVYKIHGTVIPDIPICVGTLISPDLVISAAHCFYNEQIGRVENTGAFYLSSGKPPSIRNSNVKRIDVPEKYSGSGYYSNDIALVRLRESVFPGKNVQLDILSWNTIFRSEQIQMLGEIRRWNQSMTLEDIGQKLQPTDYITYGNCNESIYSMFSRGRFLSDKFCVDSKTRLSSRFDIVGRALHVYLNNQRCLSGILSITMYDMAGDYHTHAVFTNVSHHLDWIRTFLPEARDPTFLNTGCLLPEQPTDGSFEIRSCSGDCTEGPETTVPEGRVLYYQCNEGFTFQGNGTSICKNGKWNQPQRCVKAGHITRGQLTTVNVSQPATLSCLVEGHPLSEFTWVKIDDSENSERLGDRASTSRDDKTHVAMSLNFTSVARRDNGTYECRAIDYFGTIAGQTSLIVTEVPGVSINFTISGGADSVYLNWTMYDRNDPLTMYSIQRKKEGTNKWENCSETIGVKNSSYVARGLEKNTAYEFRITAKNSIGVSQPAISNLTKTLGKDPPSFIQEATAVMVSDGVWLVEWEMPSVESQPFIHYIKIKATSNNDTKFKDVPAGLVCFEFQALEPGWFYKFTVRGCNNYTRHCEFPSESTTTEVSNNVLWISSSVSGIIVFVIMATWKYIRKRRDLASRRRFMEATLELFRAGAMNTLNPELDVADQAELLPYDKKWEFPRKRLKLGKVLGSGAFGIVKRGWATSICRKRETTTVAVKMVRATHSLEHMTAVTRELKILAHLGKHLNIVNLLGACTARISYGELLVIVEFCRFGNLHDYLLRRREHFVDQIDAATGTVTGSSLPTSRTEVLDSGIDTVGSENIAVTVNYDHIVDSVAIDESAFKGDYVLPDQGDLADQGLALIGTRDLLSWAWQVSRGMKYLGSRRVVHGDLAARNVLLADHKVVKICDFGLAKCLYVDDIYKKSGRGPLPIKWMAIESIRDRVFSVKSDIWSFGIVLWEFFALAETPYPGIENETVYQKVVDGFRMGRPKYATEDIYNMMLRTWNADPRERPSFAELEDPIEDFLERKVKTDYLDLEAPYAELNAKESAEGRRDYLTMRPAELALNSTEPTADPSVEPV